MPTLPLLKPSSLETLLWVLDVKEIQRCCCCNSNFFLCHSHVSIQSGVDVVVLWCCCCCFNSIHAFFDVVVLWIYFFSFTVGELMLLFYMNWCCFTVVVVLWIEFVNGVPCCCCSGFVVFLMEVLGASMVTITMEEDERYQLRRIWPRGKN